MASVGLTQIGLQPSLSTDLDCSAAGELSSCSGLYQSTARYRNWHLFGGEPISFVCGQYKRFVQDADPFLKHPEMLNVSQFLQSSFSIPAYRSKLFTFISVAPFTYKLMQLFSNSMPISYESHNPHALSLRSNQFAAFKHIGPVRCNTSVKAWAHVTQRNAISVLTEYLSHNTNPHWCDKGESFFLNLKFALTLMEALVNKLTVNKRVNWPACCARKVCRHRTVVAEVAGGVRYSLFLRMGALQSQSDHHEYVDLAQKTGFSFEQIGVLHKRFKQLSHDEETLRRDHFNEIPDLACNPIRAQIIGAFFDRRNYRQNSEGTVEEIDFENFLVVMSHFRPPSLHLTEEQRDNVRREKLRFLFNMHDTDNDGTITLEEYRHVVEELLSRSGALGKETAKSIADAAMLEVASISMGHMEPDEFYEGITFEHFFKLLKGFEIESKMNIHFWNMDTSTLCK
ncbi:calcineurin B-likeous protein 3-like [Solea senegalensis]|uniref:Calcineurin B-likeous protein 3-like n=2 Tax=Solea senegalensis TaxID=28829 RepID=A0AAV6R1W0_SOLSE|nr:calcineurin B-likeous protein 3-like [Solea senegalensis]